MAGYNDEVANELVRKASRTSTRHVPEKERDEFMLRDGAKNLKRRIFGLCGMNIQFKSVDELSRILVNTSIASSLEEGRTILHKFDGCRFRYNTEGLAIGFDKIIDNEDERYRIAFYEPFIFG